MERNDIIIIHGTNYKEMAIQVLEKADVASRPPQKVIIIFMDSVPDTFISKSKYPVG